MIQYSLVSLRLKLKCFILGLGNPHGLLLHWEFLVLVVLVEVVDMEEALLGID
jgi:hypothetical protein